MTPTPVIPRRAVIIAVGSELLTPFRSDTNSLAITAALNELGIEVTAKLVVGDRRAALAAAIRESLPRTDLLVLTGGLGPTDDDVTRAAVADALDLDLSEDPAIVERIRERFTRRGLEMPEVNRVQALVLAGATVLANPHGTAPGQWIENDARAVLLLPGPPREMRPMLERVLVERVAPRVGGARLVRRVLKIAARAESHVEQRVQPLYATFAAWDPPVAATILAAPGQIELHLSARASSAHDAGKRVDGAVAEMLRVLGEDVFSVDGRSLEHVVGDALRARGWHVAIAESCTGGLIASRLTDVPGSSAYVDRGLVCYSNRAKMELLGVPDQMLRAHGAVSMPVGLAMAEGVRARTGAEVALGVTGIAGPGGGTPEKPVGTVVVAVVAPDGAEVRRFRLIGGREPVKRQASQVALEMLRRRLVGAPAL